MSNNNEKRDPLLCHWADQMADKIIQEKGDLDSYTCASGITPSGTVHLVGTDYDKIVKEVSTLLEDSAAYEKMSKAVNPYGDGKACNRIVRILNGEQVERYGC